MTRGRRTSQLKFVQDISGNSVVSQSDIVVMDGDPLTQFFMNWLAEGIIEMGFPTQDQRELLDENYYIQLKEKKVMDFYTRTRFWNNEIKYMVKYSAQDYVCARDQGEKKVEYSAHSDCACGSGE